MLHNIKLANFLTFSDESPDVEMQELNVILGRNGGGKSSFIDAIELLRSAPDEKAFAEVIKRIEPEYWLYMGNDELKPATLEFVLHNVDEATTNDYEELLYSFSLMVEGAELVISNESLVGITMEEDYIFYSSNDGNPLVRRDNELVEAGEDKPGPGQTCLSYYTDPKRYPVIASVARELKKTKIYRNWSFGCDTAIRKASQTDLPSDCLNEDFTNLPLVLDKLIKAGLKPVLLKHLHHFYVDTADFFVQTDNGKAQIFLNERPFKRPIPHLSDGIYHLLAVLCILFDPDMPPIVCIEQPELGLHPNIMGTVGFIMKEVLDPEKECVMIVNTYSTELVDSLTESPDDVLLCDKFGNGTQIERLDGDRLILDEEITLGELWINNSIGGNLWAY